MILLGGGGLWAFNKVKAFVTCTISITAARKAILMYEREKGHFPDADKWQTEVAPYYKQVMESKKGKNDRGPFKVWNFDESLVCVDEPSPTGVAYNEELAGKKLTDIKDPYNTYLLFEVANTGMNLHQKYVHRGRETYPKMMDKPRPWLELPVSGSISGGDSSSSMHISTDSDFDSDDSTPPKPPATPGKGNSKGNSDSEDGGV